VKAGKEAAGEEVWGGGKKEVDRGGHGAKVPTPDATEAAAGQTERAGDEKKKLTLGRDALECASPNGKATSPRSLKTGLNA